MKPHSTHSVRIRSKKRDLTPEERFAKLGPIARRHGRFPKGTVLPETQVAACPRVKVADLPKNFLPAKYFEALEHNQQIPHCCRHPENHEIEARKSHPEEKVPDIYIFHCNVCNNRHIRFCVGMEDVRPVWEAA